MGVSIYSSVSFRDKTVYLLKYGKVIIAPPNTALCLTFRNIDQCHVAPFARHFQVIKDNCMPMWQVVPIGVCRTFWITTELGSCFCVDGCTPGSSERRSVVVRQEMLCGSHTLYPTLESIHMTSLL